MPLRLSEVTHAPAHDAGGTGTSGAAPLHTFPRPGPWALRNTGAPGPQPRTMTVMSGGGPGLLPGTRVQIEGAGIPGRTGGPSGSRALKGERGEVAPLQAALGRKAHGREASEAPQQELSCGWD